MNKYQKSHLKIKINLSWSKWSNIIIIVKYKQKWWKIVKIVKKVKNNQKGQMVKMIKKLSEWSKMSKVPVRAS